MRAINPGRRRRDPVDRLPVLSDPLDREAQLLLDGAADEPPHRVLLPSGHLDPLSVRRALGAAKSMAKLLAGALVEGYSLRAWPPAKPAELPEDSPTGITGRLDDKRTDAPA